MLRAVVFDMDGTLVDSEAFGAQLDNMFLERFGHQIDEEFAERLVGANGKKAFEMIKEHFQMPHALESLIEDYRKFTLEKWKAVPDLRLNQGIPELIARLQASNLPLALATSAHKDRLDIFLERLQLKQAFHAVVCGDDVAHSKPAPDIYLRAAEMIHVDPRDCVAIEDSKAGALSAKVAGMKVVGYKIATNKQDLSIADRIIDHFDDLTIEALHSL